MLHKINKIVYNIFLSKIKIIIIISFIMFVIPTKATAYQNLKYQFSVLSKYQFSVLKYSCKVGIKYNLCYTLSAIAWQESDFGLYNIDLQDPSAGIYHIKISNAMYYLKLDNTPFNRNRVAQWLMRYPGLSSKLAIKELRYWLRYWGGSWYKAVGSYNGGFKPNNNYANEIVRKVKFLENHVKF